MPNGGTPTSKWLEPQTIFGFIGLLGLGYGSYLSFQSDVTSRVGVLETKVAVLQSQVEDMRGRK